MFIKSCTASLKHVIYFIILLYIFTQLKKLTNKIIQPSKQSVIYVKFVYRFLKK